MSHCVVFGCNNCYRNSKGKVKFFRFPSDPAIQQLWIRACRRSDFFNVNTARICSVHFEQNAFEKSLQQQLLGYSPKRCRKLKPEAVPRLNLPVCMVETEVSKRRRERISNRGQRKLVHQLLEDNAVQESSNSCEVSAMVEHANVEPENLHTKMKKLEAENESLKVKVKELEDENVQLHLRLEEQGRNIKENTSKYVEDVLLQLFSPGQVKCILNPGKRIVWSETDISAAISLRYVSARAYRYLRNQLKFPLPSPTTLKSWVGKYDFSPGIQKNVLSIMKIRSEHLSDLERLTVISFDEMKVKNELCMDRKLEQILGPSDQVQTVMARSLFGKWKQPVFYGFDQVMTKRLLLEIITALEENGYKVVAQVSVMGPTNRTLWNELGISIECTSFKNPCDNSRDVFVFADVPHVMKLFRNHLVDQGFVLSNGNKISVYILEKLFSLKDELNIIPKITQEHLNPTLFRRQKVKLATQLLSNTVAKALEYCHEKGKILEDIEDTARVIKLMNNFFDVFNSSVLHDKQGPRHAYGTNLESQNKILDDVLNLVKGLRVVRFKSLQPFQRGIIVSIKSLKGLYSYIREHHGEKFLLTTKLNQDVLECFFSYMRGIGHTNDHPNCIDWKQRIRAFIMGKHSESIFTVNCNTVDNSKEECLIQFHKECTRITELEKELCITVDVLKDLFPSNPLHQESDTEEQELQNVQFESDAEEQELQRVSYDQGNDSLEDDGLIYIAGYVAFRYRAKYPWLGNTTSTLEPSRENWIMHLSKGGLMHPSDDFLEVIRYANREFKNFHGEYISKEKFIFSKLIEAITTNIDSKWPKDVISLFVRTRTYIRIKMLNCHLKDPVNGRQLKNKFKKITA